MKKVKVMTVVGTRPEIIRLSAVIKKLDLTDSVEHILVHTGQNYDYELNEIFFNDLELRNPDYFLNAAQGSPIETIGNILIRIDSIISDVKPDAFLILGDTNSALCAIAAKRRHVPIFHMEAGNRSFDERVPEETNRRIVDHIADVNMPYSDIAREYLLREGISPDRIIKTGSPMYEVLQNQLLKINASNILANLNLKANEYFVVSAHREENINTLSNFEELIDSLNNIAEKYQLPIIVSTHPRTRKMIDENMIQLNPLIQLLKPLGFNDYVKLQVHAKVVLSDSGTISEETSILGLKSLNIRYSHERPEAMEEATVMLVGLRKENLLPALNLLIEDKLNSSIQVKDYTVPNVSDKVVRIILSLINRWGI